MLEDDYRITTPLLLHYDDVSARQVSAWYVLSRFEPRFFVLKYTSDACFFSMRDCQSSRVS